MKTSTRAITRFSRQRPQRLSILRDGNLMRTKELDRPRSQRTEVFIVSPRDPVYRPPGTTQVVFSLDPVTLRPGELSIVLAQLSNAIELEDDHESRNRDVRKVSSPVDDDLELGHDLEGTHRLEDPQQCSLGRVVAARVSGDYQALCTPVGDTFFLMPIQIQAFKHLASNAFSSLPTFFLRWQHEPRLVMQCHANRHESAETFRITSHANCRFNDRFTSQPINDLDAAIRGLLYCRTHERRWNSHRLHGDSRH